MAMIGGRQLFFAVKMRIGTTSPFWRTTSCQALPRNVARAGRFSMLESWPASVVSGGRSSCLTSKMHRSRLLWLFYDTICFVTLFIDHVHIKRPTNNSLLTAQNAVSRRFRENIRSYNSALSLASDKSFFLV